MNNRPHPIAGEDYPCTYQEFLEWLNDELGENDFVVSSDEKTSV